MEIIHATSGSAAHDVVLVLVLVERIEWATGLSMSGGSQLKLRCGRPLGAVIQGCVASGDRSAPITPLR